MRYINCTINANENKIMDTAKIRWKDYDYDSPISAVNKYMYRHIISNVMCFIYRVEGEVSKAAFFYHEDKLTLKNAWNAINDKLLEIADICIEDTEPEEITTYQYLECLQEAKRRFYAHGYNYLTEANEFIYNYMHDTEKYAKYGFTLDEKLVPSKREKYNEMYDQSLLVELKNIETPRKKSKIDVNVVHYVVASKSTDAAIDIVSSLTYSLLKANRISSRRIEIVSELDTNAFQKHDNLERIIEGNRGGVVVIDLNEKLGNDPVSYSLCCQYIEKLMNKYKNYCLFVFTYNMDNTGFAFKLLPMIQDQAILVKIKEGTGTRDNAIDYLKSLIKESEYSKYANQAGEFLENYRGNKFTQSDVIDAFHKFGPWCINRNFYGTYNYNISEDICLARDDDTETSSEKLRKLIGLETVKAQINKIIITHAMDKERIDRNDGEYTPGSMHMIFAGNPGSAKTTVAKLFAGTAKERGILKSGAFIESGGNDYNGLLGASILKRNFEAAKGGVLFIDEAYAIDNDSVITILLQEIENKRNDVIVVLAGYNERMEKFLDSNEGLKSRIPYWVDFPDYSTEELVDMFKLMASDKGISVAAEAMNEVYYVLEKARLLDNFGNGRFVRNLIEKAIQNQSLRLNDKYADVLNVPENELFLLTKEDIELSDEFRSEAREIGTAKRELDEMIGIKSAKKIIARAIASFKVKKLFIDKGISKEKPSMHMVFTGNPGTAKTTTARLLAEILKDEKVLPSGKFVEVGRGDLIGTHVGSTAPLVKKRFKEAQGGVLFIDEAYSLCDNAAHSFGDEAISTIVQEMENHRDDVIVIFAGYPDEMQEFLERNPGMASRIAFHVEFDDYSTDELCDIARLMLKKKSLQISDEAMNKLTDVLKSVKKDNDYGNGRYVRKLIEEAEMNLAQRIYAHDDLELDMDYLTTIEADDIEQVQQSDSSSYQIGFRAF